MSSRTISALRRGVSGIVLLGVVAGSGVLLAVWKRDTKEAAAAEAARQPEPVEKITVALAQARPHQTSTTAIGTVLALRSITLKSEVSGTVARASLTPGAVVEAGTVLVSLDTFVEQAELRALDAQARLSDTMLGRREELLKHGATTQDEVDQARAQRDVAHAQSARLRAVIAKKTVKAPFRARVGLADVHPGQYLNEGFTLTTLQGLDDEVHVDFAVAQDVAARLPIGSTVEVRAARGEALSARVVAVDAKVDPGTRTALVRARLARPRSHEEDFAPGASVRVLVPVGESTRAVVVPVSALRKGPEGDHVWVIAADERGALRARERKVESGTALGEVVTIASGLAAGDRVAASGSFKLREGLRVEPVESPAAK